jgi:hypothetical protein
MNLSIESLAKSKSFTGAPVKKDIEWEQKGKTLKATTYVRPLSYHSSVSDIRAYTDDGDPVAGRIAACICDENGEPVFTVADIIGEADPERGPLDGNLTMALLQAIGEVNSLGKTES